MSVATKLAKLEKRMREDDLKRMWLKKAVLAGKRAAPELRRDVEKLLAVLRGPPRVPWHQGEELRARLEEVLARERRARLPRSGRPGGVAR